VDVPISLEIGTIVTSEFPVTAEDYLIMVQAEKRLPLVEMECMMGLSQALDRPKCGESLIHAEWSLFDGTSPC